MKLILQIADGALSWDDLAAELPSRAILDFYGKRFVVASATASPIAYLKRIYRYFLSSGSLPGSRRMILLDEHSEPCRRLFETLWPRATVRGHLLLDEGLGRGIVLADEALLRYYASKLLRLAVVEVLQDEMLTLHAASLEVGAHGVLLVGEAASGKTSTTLRLLDQGARYAADDTSCIRRRDRFCVPFPMPLLLRSDPRLRRGSTTGPQRKDPPEAVAAKPDIQIVDEARWLCERWDAVADEFHPDHLLFFGEPGAGEGVLAELSPACAALRLLRNVMLPLGARDEQIDPDGRDFDLAIDLVESAYCFAVDTRDLDKAFRGMQELFGKSFNQPVRATAQGGHQ